MSQVLYEADNLSIKGHTYTVAVYDDNISSIPTSGHTINCWNCSSESIKTGDVTAIHLYFTLLINGKLKTFGWSFIIEKDNENWFEYSLAQWSDWNVIYFILQQLWYKIDNNEYIFWQWIVREWIGKIMN